MVSEGGQRKKKIDVQRRHNFRYPRQCGDLHSSRTNFVGVQALARSQFFMATEMRLVMQNSPIMFRLTTRSCQASQGQARTRPALDDTTGSARSYSRRPTTTEIGVANRLGLVFVRAGVMLASTEKLGFACFASGKARRLFGCSGPPAVMCPSSAPQLIVPPLHRWPFDYTFHPPPVVPFLPGLSQQPCVWRW